MRWHRIRSKSDGFRGWLYIGKHSFHLQVVRHRGSYGAAIKWGGQETLLAGNLIAWLGIFWSWSPPFSWNRRVPWSGKYNEIEREIALSWHGGILWWRFLCPTMGSSRDRFHHEFHIGDWLLGRPVYTRELLESDIPVSITVGQWPEDGPYTGTAQRWHCEWKRRFSTLRRDDVMVSMNPPGLPLPGKGENSWDCDDDGIYGFGGLTLESAIEHAIASVKRDRLRYGGPKWRPASEVNG